MRFLSQYFAQIAIVVLLAVAIVNHNELWPDEDQQSAQKAEVAAESQQVTESKPPMPVSTVMPASDPSSPLVERREKTREDAQAWESVVETLADNEPAAPSLGESETTVAKPDSVPLEPVSTDKPQAATSDAFAEKRSNTDADAKGWAKVVDILADVENKSATPKVDDETVSSAKTAKEDEAPMPVAENDPVVATEADASKGMLKWEITTADGKPNPPVTEAVSDPPHVSVAPAVESPAKPQTLNDARRAFHEGDAKAAAMIYQSVLERNPANHAAAGELGNVFMSMRQWDKATEAYMRTARILFDQGHWPQAMSMVQIVGKVNPKQAIALGNELNQKLRVQRTRPVGETK